MKVIAIALLFLVICAPSFANSMFNDSELTIIRSFKAPDLPFVDTTNQYANNLAAKKLGKQLFFDTRLSSNGKVSCASCHSFSRSLVDNKDLAVGITQGLRNTPTLINVGMQRWFFWDGRADSLWLQAISPIESKHEMGTNWQKVYYLFTHDKNLLESYNRVFINTPLAVSTPYFKIDQQRFKSNLGKAIAAFEMDLVQFNSKFDQFVNAITEELTPQDYLTEQEQIGLQLFIGKGQCVQCHFGANLSDGEFHNVRLKTPAGRSEDTGRYGAIDGLKQNPLNTLGLYSDDNSVVKTKFLQKSEPQWAAFKTPTLRNVALTAPYMHDGRLATLRAVLEHYSTFSHASPNHHQNPLLEPLNLNEAEFNALEAFLNTLTGTITVPSY